MTFMVHGMVFIEMKCSYFASLFLESTTKFRSLVVILDSDLNFHSHITNITTLPFFFLS